MTSSSLKDRVFDLLHSADYALSAPELAERAGAPVEAVLAELISEGRIKYQGSRTERAYYTDVNQLR
jgi:hypothetical protein